MAIKLVKAINLTNDITEADDGRNLRIKLDTSEYSGTVYYYLEAMVWNADSVAHNVLLKNENDSTETSVAIPANTGTYARFRGSAFTPNNTYPVKYVDVDHVSLTLNAARILIFQDAGSSLTDTESQIEMGAMQFYMWGTEAPFISPKFWTYNSANWDGTVTFFAEVYWAAVNDKYAVSVILQEDDGSWNWSNKVTIVDEGTSEAWTLTRVGFTPSGSGRHYRLVVTTVGTKGSYGINVAGGKIIVNQTGTITKTESTFLFMNKSADADGLTYCAQYYDSAYWEDLTVDFYHEMGSGDTGGALKLQSDPYGTPADITNSSLTGVANQSVRGGSALGMVDDKEIDTYITDYDFPSYSRIVAIVVVGAGGQTIVMDSLALTAGPPALGVVPGLATILANSLGLSSSGPGLRVAPTLLMDSLALASTPPTLSVVPGLATIIVDSLSLGANCPILSVVPGLATLNLNSLGLTALPPALSVELALTIILNSLGLTATPPGLNVVPGLATIVADSLQLLSQAVSVDVVPGLVTLVMSTAALNGVVPSLGVVPGLAAVILDSLGLQANTPIIIVVTEGGPQTIILNSLGLAAAPPSAAVVPGVVTVELDSLPLNAQAIVLSVVEGGAPVTEGSWYVIMRRRRR